jgi:signal transduction histidine kinase
VLTADISPVTRQRALVAGARDFLTKPFDEHELRLRIRNVLETRFLHLGLRRQNQSLDALVVKRTGQLEEAQRQAIQQERLHAFSEMASGVVHDFNNIIMIVTGYAELLSSMSLDKEAEHARRCIESIHTAALDAGHVVNRLRHFYRPRHEDDLLLPADLKSLAEKAADLSKPCWKEQALADGRDIALQLDLNKVPPVLCNPSELREVMLNLIFNAVDAMPNGGVLTIRVGSKDDTVFFEIGDTGTGMNEEVRQRCLEPFFSTKGKEGTGLGLAMVHGIIRRHEGTLEIESEEGHGTIFRANLPAFYGPIQTKAEVSAAPTTTPLRILMAEDDARLRELIAEQLTADGHTVEQTENGAEALARLHESSFNVVLTDLSMPRMNGAALAAAVRELKPTLPVIMLTGFGEMLLKEGEKPFGVDLLLSKPIGHEKLTAALTRMAV